MARRIPGLLPLLFSLLLGCQGGRELPTVMTTSADLPLVLVESGEIIAHRSNTVRAPFEWGGDLQIVRLVAEGTIVQKGDTLAQFDPGFLEEDFASAKVVLEVKQAERSAILARQKSRDRELENSKLLASLAEDRARLQWKKQSFESAVKRRQAELELKTAVISTKQARLQIRIQSVLDSLELARTDLEIASLRSRMTGMRTRIGALTLIAPAAGMVLYAERRQQDQRVKVRVGDKIRPRGKVIEIPDLSEMEVRFLVNEVDRGRLKEGQGVVVRLEAEPDKEFRGEVSRIARLVTSRDGEENVRGFTVLARVRWSDPLLLPGMSAIVEVTTSTLKNQILVPQTAVFERKGRPVVFPRAEWPQPHAVELGSSDPYHAVCEKGLGKGVALVTRAPGPAFRPWGESEFLTRSSMNGKAP